MRQKADATRNKSMREAAPTVFGAPTESATKPKTRTGTRTNTSADTTRTVIRGHRIALTLPYSVRLVAGL